MTSKINIAIVDDNSFLISAIKDKLSFYEEIIVKTTASNGHEIVDNMEVEKHIQLILMDIEMPVKNGIAATLKIKQKWPHIKIIMLTVFDNDENIFNAIKAGADGYLLKDIEPQKLYNGILETLKGGAAMTPSIALRTLNLLRTPLLPDTNKIEETVQLSNREVEVLEQLATGLTYTVIADNLFISPSTVRRHIENIYKKLQVHSKIEAIQLAKKKRII